MLHIISRSHNHNWLYNFSTHKFESDFVCMCVCVYTYVYIWNSNIICSYFRRNNEWLVCDAQIIWENERREFYVWSRIIHSCIRTYIYTYVWQSGLNLFCYLIRWCRALSVCVCLREILLVCISGTPMRAFIRFYEWSMLMRFFCVCTCVV